ncbi:MAG: hypothetical protein ACI4GY_07195 [Acutalibacteraceae bacterium]
MNLKRILALIVALAMLTVVAAVPFCASAVTFDEENLQIKPGNTQSKSPVYSLSWLDKLIVRDDATSVTTARMVPKAEYPYSTTYDEFVSDVNNYTILNALNEDTLTDSLNSAMKAFYYVVTAMGMTTDLDEMYSFVSNKGIRVPANMDSYDKIELAVVYACIKYKAVYVFYGKDIKFTKGTTLDEAAAIILSQVGGFSIPSTVKSVSGLSMYFMKDYIDDFDEIPLSDNPDMDELFHWIRAIASSKQGYSIPMIEYGETTQAQRDYVNYCYYATIFDTIYDININPFELVKADNEGDVTSIPKLILTTMLDEKNVAYDETAKCENLFDLACQNGCFELDEEFYSDIYSYDLYVVKSCEKLWFTPFALADQLGGDNSFLTVNVAGKKISSAVTTYAKLSPSKENETVKVVVIYNDPNGEHHETTYTFNIIKTEAKDKTSENSDDLVSKVETAIKGVIPEDNEKANSIVDGVFSSVKNAASGASQIVESAKNDFTSDEISTYAVDESKANLGSESEAYSDSTSSGADSGFEFNYLSELFNETYAETEAKSYSSYPTTASTTESNDSVVEKTVTAIKENPEIVAAPTGVVTFGALAGYLFTKKRKNTSELSEDKDEDIDDI